MDNYTNIETQFSLNGDELDATWKYASTEHPTEDEGDMEFVSILARDVISAYQTANKWLDSVKEAIYIDMSCPFFSSFVHKLAHTMPGRFDKFGDILHTVNMKVPYPATEEIEHEPENITDAFQTIFSVLDSIKSTLNAFIKETDSQYHGMSCSAEALLNDIELEYPMLYRLRDKWNQCEGDTVSFDKYVMHYVEHKDDLVESFKRERLSEGYGYDYSSIPEVKIFNTKNSVRNGLPGIFNVREFVAEADKISSEVGPKFKIRTSRIHYSYADIKDAWMDLRERGWSVQKSFDSSLSGFNEVYLFSKKSITESARKYKDGRLGFGGKYKKNERGYFQNFAPDFKPDLINNQYADSNSSESSGDAVCEDYGERKPMVIKPSKTMPLPVRSTLHNRVDRVDRNRAVSELGIGKPVRTFLVDKFHPNGPEYHTLTDTGMIVVSNQRTGKLCTTLIARPGQIRRYYEACGERAPSWLTDIARQNQIMGYNER